MVKYKKYKNFYDLGFQVFPGILEDKEVDNYKQLLRRVYSNQVNDFTLEKLRKIGEENTCRSPFLEERQFVNIFYNDFSKTIIRDLLGEYAILSLQNGIIIPAKQEHHQGFYHRDIIHQNFTSSRPLSINLYYCLTDFSLENGGTMFIPKSHEQEEIPENLCPIAPNVPAGSVIVFNSMVFHKAGTNKSTMDRIGINNMVSLPFVKQQIRYPHILKKTDDKDLNKLLGFESLEYLGVQEFRNHRLNRIRDEK
jgi:hypothetical protein